MPDNKPLPVDPDCDLAGDVEQVDDNVKAKLELYNSDLLPKIKEITELAKQKGFGLMTACVMKADDPNVPGCAIMIGTTRDVEYMSPEVAIAYAILTEAVRIPNESLAQMYYASILGLSQRKRNSANSKAQDEQCAACPHRDTSCKALADEVFGRINAGNVPVDTNEVVTLPCGRDIKLSSVAASHQHRSSIVSELSSALNDAIKKIGADKASSCGGSCSGDSGGCASCGGECGEEQPKPDEEAGEDLDPRLFELSKGKSRPN